jgi:hypothetical protein
MPVPAISTKRGDFADWLSPILVKELRQGLQSKLFVGVFVLLQAAMVLFVGLGLISVSEDRNSTGSIFQGFFQMCVWMPLLIFMPARGLRAIGDETRAQTLDLVQLTRMSSFRIVWGKWLALVAQSCLLASAMLPYAVLQYYFGKVDVVGELVWFAVLLIGSMVLTAAAVGMSSAHVGVRALVLLMVVFSMSLGGFNFYFLRTLSGAVAFSFKGVGEAAAWIIPSAALYIYFFLELGASKIAPLAENHSARKRALAVALAGVIAVAGWCCRDEVVFALVGISVPIMGFVVLESLCEIPVLMPGIYHPFTKHGMGGRLLGRLLYPGWASGVIFAAVVHALLWAGLAGAYRHTTGASELDHAIFRSIGPMMFAALVSPLPILALFPRLTKRFWPYLLVQVLCVLLFTVATIISQAAHGDRSGPFMLLAPCPTAALFALLSHSDQKDVAQWLLNVAPIADAVLFIWLAVLMVRQFRIIRKMEDLSLGKDRALEAAT